MFQVSAPYNRILSTGARKNASLVSLEILDFHIRCSLLQADQASALRMLKSLLQSLIYNPRYLKSSTVFIDVHLRCEYHFQSILHLVTDILFWCYSVSNPLYMQQFLVIGVVSQHYLSGRMVKQYHRHGLSL